jgi:hypothetical protein
MHALETLRSPAFASGGFALTPKHSLDLNVTADVTATQ